MRNKHFKFIYKQQEPDNCGLFPTNTVIKADFTFDEDSRWVPILFQFCQFLESTGYVGVSNRIIIKDPLGVEVDGCLFDTIHEDDFYEDEEDEDEEEEDATDFQDIKREIA